MIFPFSADASRKIVPSIIGGMVFLAVLSLALALSLIRLSQDWQSDLVGGATVQIPAPNDLPREQIERHVAAALELLKNTPGVINATPVSEAQTHALLSPWFGEGGDNGQNRARPENQRTSKSGKVTLGESAKLGGLLPKETTFAQFADSDWLDLPIPRLIDVTLDADQFDGEKFRQNLATKLPGASFDDHISWLSGLMTMAHSLQILSFLVVILVGGVAILTVSFTTHSGMEIHRDVIDVLHMMGAQDQFIADKFVRYQAGLALRGALWGEGLALALIWLLSLAKDRLFPGIGLDFGPGMGGFFMIVMVLPLMVGLACVTAWRTSLHVLRGLS
ncbi:MAG: hypothetical protein ORN98_09385 [Alphaproteobacteria bacterium]|nr:hypothetical protein [Alphaproteobacteria bacterium]